MKKVLLIFILAAILFCLPFLLNIAHTFPRLDSDYDSQMGMYQYIGEYVRTFHTIPLKIPFVGTGISVLGDPLNALFNPFFSLPFVFFNANIAIRLVIIINAFFSELAMFILLKKLKVSRFLQIAGSLLYMSAGSFTASVAAGHITEKFLVYPIYPLFLIIIFQKRLSFKKMVFAGLILGATIYCGDLYAAWFLSIFLFLTRTYFFVKEKQKIHEGIMVASIISIAIIFASPKLYFFIHDVLPILKRTNIVNPFLGSINFFLVPLQFLLPFQVNFYDRPFFQRHLGFYYNWYEYYAFLGVFPLIFLKNIKKVFHQTEVKICLLLLITGSLYIASAFWYSPFHYLFFLIKPLDVFRVPQRFIIPLTSVAVVLICLCAQSWKNKKPMYVFFALGLFWTYGVAWFTFSYTFVSIPKSLIVLAHITANVDKTDLPVINVGGLPEYLLVQEKIPVVNYYYGWVPKDTPDVFNQTGKVQKSEITKSKAVFIVSSDLYNFTDIHYEILVRYKNKIIWKRR